MVQLPIAVGVNTREHIFEEAARQQAGRLRTVYEAHEFTVNNGETNSSIKTIINHVTTCTCARGAFTLLDRCQRMLMRNLGGGNILVRVNRTTADHDPFTWHAGETIDFSMIEFDDIFFTNSSGVNSAVSIVMN